MEAINDMFDKDSLDRLFEELRGEFELETDWEAIQRDAHLALAYADVGFLSDRRQVLDSRSVDFVERHSSLLEGLETDTERRDATRQSIDLTTLADMTYAEIEALYGEEIAINAGILNDADALVPTSEQLAKASPTVEVIPDWVTAWQVGAVNIPAQSAVEKVRVEVVLDSDIVQFFQNLDPNWVTRLNRFLRVVIFRHSPAPD